MGMGVLTWTCLLLVLHADPSDPRGLLVYRNDPHLMIPINQRKGNVSEYLLYVSTDQGASWSKYDTVKAKPGSSEPLGFRFSPREDGEYWFKLATVDVGGIQHPKEQEIIRRPNDLRVVVDRRAPQVKVHAERVGQEIEVRWMIQEDHPDQVGPKLEYHTAQMPPTQWTPVVAERGTSVTRFNPGTTAAVQVRMVLRDRAGNVGEHTDTVASVGGAPPAGEIGTVSNWTTDSKGLPAHTASQLPSTPAPDPVEPQHKVSGSGVPLTGGVGGMGGEERPAPGPAPVQNPPAPSNTRPAPNPPFSGTDFPPAPSTSQGNVSGPAAPSPTGPAAPPTARELGSAPPQAPLGTNEGTPSSGPGTPTPLAQSVSGGAEGAGASGEGAAGALPAVQLVNQPQVKLDFEVGRCGPSGLGSVDVFVTSDDGTNWQQIEGTPPVTLLPGGPPQAGVPVKGSVAVMIPREQTVYGFYMVVKNRAGRGQPPPTPGTLPQVRVELDRTLPDAKLWPPQPDPTNHNAAVLIWQATDKNLTKEPITLEWAEKAEGPWQVIASNYPNSGKYSWVLPERLPTAVFLKLSVTDRAGNVGVAATIKPVLIDLTPPEFRVLGIHR